MSDNVLDVLLFGNHIGSLSRTKKGVRFQFDESTAYGLHGSPLLSCALTVQADPFNAAQTFSWFSGLLPEDARLGEMRRYYGIAEDDYFELLAQIGWECAGAVEIVPPESQELLHLSNENESRLELSPLDLARRLSALPLHPYDGPSALRVSLGGFQEKLCVILNPSELIFTTPGHAHLDKAALPLDGAPSTHILKPQPLDRLPGMIEAEAWGMEASRRATETARSALLDLDEAPTTLLVERFDRSQSGNRITRIHQEDCAQALGIDPGRKYAATSSPKKSDPSYRAIAELLSQYAENPLEERQKLLRHMTVNVILGNTDAHAKNFAFLHEGNTIRLAPLYDVIPALEITPKMLFMGMRIGGRIRIDRIEHSDIEKEARSWGLPSRMVGNIVDETMERLREGIAAASEIYPRAASRHNDPAMKRLEALAR